MKTLIAIMQYVGFALTAAGFVYSFGMLVADEIYKRVLGASVYWDVDAIGIWNVIWMPALGGAILVISYIMDMVFRAGEESAAKEEDDK